MYEDLDEMGTEGVSEALISPVRQGRQRPPMRLAPLRWIGLRLSSAFFQCVESKEQRAQRKALEEEQQKKTRLTRHIQLLQCKIGTLEKQHQAVRLKMVSCSSPIMLRTYNTSAKKLAINIRDQNRRMALAIQALAALENSRGVREDVEIMKNVGLIVQTNTEELDVTEAIAEFKMGSKMLEKTGALYDHILEDDYDDDDEAYSLGDHTSVTFSGTEEHGPSTIQPAQDIPQEAMLAH